MADNMYSNMMTQILGGGDPQSQMPSDPSSAPSPSGDLNLLDIIKRKLASFPNLEQAGKMATRTGMPLLNVLDYLKGVLPKEPILSLQRRKEGEFPIQFGMGATPAGTGTAVPDYLKKENAVQPVTQPTSAGGRIVTKKKDQPMWSGGEVSPKVTAAGSPLTTMPMQGEDPETTGMGADAESTIQEPTEIPAEKIDIAKLMPTDKKLDYEGEFTSIMKDAYPEWKDLPKDAGTQDSWLKQLTENFTMAMGGTNPTAARMQIAEHREKEWDNVRNYAIKRATNVANAKLQLLNFKKEQEGKMLDNQRKWVEKVYEIDPDAARKNPQWWSSFAYVTNTSPKEVQKYLDQYIDPKTGKLDLMPSQFDREINRENAFMKNRFETYKKYYSGDEEKANMAVMGITDPMQQAMQTYMNAKNKNDRAGMQKAAQDVQELRDLQHPEQANIERFMANPEAYRKMFPNHFNEIKESVAASFLFGKDIKFSNAKPPSVIQKVQEEAYRALHGGPEAIKEFAKTHEGRTPMEVMKISSTMGIDTSMFTPIEQRMIKRGKGLGGKNLIAYMDSTNPSYKFAHDRELSDMANQYSEHLKNLNTSMREYKKRDLSPEEIEAAVNALDASDGDLEAAGLAIIKLKRK